MLLIVLCSFRSPGRFPNSDTFEKWFVNYFSDFFLSVYYNVQPNISPNFFFFFFMNKALCFGSAALRSPFSIAWANIEKCKFLDTCRRWEPRESGFLDMSLENSGLNVKNISEHVWYEILLYSFTCLKSGSIYKKY